MRKRIGRIGWIVLAVALIAGLAAVLWPRPNPGSYAIVRRGSLSTTVDALGRVVPLRQASISASVSALVNRVALEEGQEVEQGELLLELDQTETHENLDQAERALRLQELALAEALSAPDEAAIRLAKAKLRQATAARRVAQRDYDQIADTENAEDSDEALDLEVAKMQYEIADAEFDRVLEGTPKLDLERLRTGLADGKLRVAQLQRRLEQARLMAPFAGTILAVTAQEGAMAYAGNQLVLLADLTAFEIRAEVDELDVASVAVGQKVEIRLDAFPGEMLMGTVQRVLPNIIEDRGATAYAAIIQFEGTTLPLRTGMGANLKIISQEVTDALLIPSRAVKQAGRFNVVRVREGHQETLVRVEVGLSNDTEVEVLSGLSEGQMVVLD